MELRSLSSHELDELNKLALIDNLDITDPRITNGAFYIALQEETTLNANNITDLVTPSVLLLIARIASQCPNMHNVSMAYNKLGKFGPPIAKEIAGSLSISILDFSNNELGEHGPQVAKEFSLSSSLNVIDISHNLFVNYSGVGLIVIQELVRSSFIHSINIKLGTYYVDEVIFLNHARKMVTERNESIPTAGEIMKLIVEADTPLPDTVIVDIIAEYAVSSPMEIIGL